MVMQRQDGVSIPEQVASGMRAGLGDRLLAVILFGSWARGEGTSSSDWDILVVAEGLPDRIFERRVLLLGLLPPRLRGVVSLLAKTPQEFGANLPSLYLDIALDGQVVYDRRGYAVEKIAALRQVIERAGLHRERTSAGDVWRWRTEPVGAWALQWEA